MSETKRIFIAAPLTGFTMANIHACYARQAESALREHEITAHWRPERAGSHITLRFVGDVDAGEPLERLYEAVKDVANRHAPLIITLGGKGVFDPNYGHPDKLPRLVHWVGVGGQILRLCTLAELVESAVYEAGHGAAQFDFKPHFTIGRMDCESWEDGQTLTAAWQDRPEPPGHDAPYMIHRIGMYASERMPNGSIVYVRVGQELRLNPQML